MVLPIQTAFGPVMFTPSLSSTVKVAEGLDVHPVALLVKVKVTVPSSTPVTEPLLVTVATEVLLLVHVPPVDGDNEVCEFIQMAVGPVKNTVGLSYTVTGAVASEAHPVILFVKMNVAVPAATPVTTPALLTVAIDGLLLDQVPPIDGDNVVVVPTHIVEDPEILTVGLCLAVMVVVGTAVHPKSLVTVTA